MGVVKCPRQVLCDVESHEFDIVDLLLVLSIYVEGGGSCHLPGSPEVPGIEPPVCSANRCLLFSVPL